MHASQADNGQHLLMALTRYQRKREGEIAYSFWLRTKRKIAQKFPYIYVCMYKAEDRRKDRRSISFWRNIYILFERMLKVIKG